MSLDPVNNSPNFASARALTFADGTLTPEGKSLLAQKPVCFEAEFEAQRVRIADLMSQVKELEAQNKAAREAIKQPPSDEIDEKLRALGYISDRPGS